MELEIKRLELELAKLKQEKLSNGLGIKIGEKGGVVVSGLQRFPVTLYKDSWIKLLGVSEEILDFIKKNDDKLSKK